MTDSDILKELPIQNLSIQKDGKEEEKSPEITDTLVPPSEAAAVTPKMKETEWESITEEEKDAEGLMGQELKDKEEYTIYIAGISEEEESDTETDSEESPYFF